MNTTDLKALAEHKFDVSVARKNLEERIETQLLVSHQGGMFKATMELIAFLSVQTQDVLYLPDAYTIPREVNRIVLLSSLNQAYQYAMNAWHIEYNELVKVRKAEQL